MLGSLELVWERELVRVYRAPAALFGRVCSYQESFFWVADDVIEKKKRNWCFQWSEKNNNNAMVIKPLNSGVVKQAGIFTMIEA